MPSGIELIGRGLEMAVAASPVAGGAVEEAAAWGMQVLAIAKRSAAGQPATRRHEGARGLQYQRRKARPASREKGRR